jgi:uncharacterized Tic20 family protein
MPETAQPITADDRAMAALTHLSGLSGYIVPLGGVIVPIIIWLTRRDSPVISSIAKQAVFALIVTSAILFVTLILIPLVVLFWIVLGITAVALPIVGAIKASQGTYYRYPVIGIEPN